MRKSPGAAEEKHVRAQIAAAGTAVAAVEAGAARIERCMGAGLQPGNCLAELDDDARDLMTQRHRLSNSEVPDGAAAEVVQVRPADAPECHCDSNFVTAERALFDWLDPQIPLPVTDLTQHRKWPLVKD
jgi:hypothetical protein